MSGAKVEWVDVDRIVTIEDRAERNRQITRAYARLAGEFAGEVDPENASWTQFATWTSEDVGSAIRGEQTRRRLLLRLLHRFQRDYAERAETVSAAFSAGNTEVFDQVGRACVGYHAAVQARDLGVMERFLADLPGDEYGEGLVDHPVRLRDAFAAYEAGRATSGAHRAQAIALGNLFLAIVEQSRVQAHLETAFNALARGWPRPLQRLMVRVTTEALLEVRMGPVRVRPGRRLRLPYPAPLAELDEAFAPYARLVGDRPDSDDWTDLADRLRFIAALMRALQQDPRLLGSSPLGDGTS